MATKTVLQHECDRCERVWYSDPSKEKSAETSVKVEGTIDGDLVVSIVFTELCAGCKSTVRGQLEAIGKEFKKASPVRGAKKKDKTSEKADQDKSQSASSSSTHVVQSSATSSASGGVSSLHVPKNAAQSAPQSIRR